MNHLLSHEREASMIALRSSTSDGSSFRVYDGDTLLGHIRRRRGTSGDTYIAVIDRNGQEETNGKGFDSPDDALAWIKKNIQSAQPV